MEQEKSQLLENDWRQRFRDAGGQMSDDLKSLHLQQVSHKELAKEYDGLVATLELDKAQAELFAAKRAGLPKCSPLPDAQLRRL